MSHYNPNYFFPRTYTLSGEIDEVMSKDVISFISLINELDDYKGLENNERRPIILNINSPGGSIYDGFAIIGAIKQSKTIVHTNCLGSAMSMALLVLAAGHYRIGHHLSRYMYHECLDDIPYDKMSAIRENLDEGNKLMEMFDNYLLSRTSINKRKLNKIKKDKSDWYFGSDEALELGLINNII
jgi:ATP-dependent Clp protease protease subunit